MSDTYTAAPAATTAAPSAGFLVRDGVLAAAVAACATTAVAAAGQAAGVSLAVAGAPIPPSAFAVMTGIFAALGLVIAVVLRRFAASPRTAWVRTTVVLTALSLVPDLLADAAPSTRALLMGTHLIAAAIVIPTVARRLRS